MALILQSSANLPMGWQVAGVVIAIVSLVIGILALPTILQMFFGRPKVTFEFERQAQERERVLLVFLKNPPVRNRFLKLIRVRREAVQSLTIAFRIAEAGSGIIVDPIRHATMYTDDGEPEMGQARITLPPTYSVGANFMVAIWDEQQKGVIVPPDRLRSALTLAPGYYRVSFTLLIDGEPRLEHRNFVVGEGLDDLVWMKA